MRDRGHRDLYASISVRRAGVRIVRLQLSREPLVAPHGRRRLVRPRSGVLPQRACPADRQEGRRRHGARGSHAVPEESVSRRDKRVRRGDRGGTRVARPARKNFRTWRLSQQFTRPRPAAALSSCRYQSAGSMRRAGCFDKHSISGLPRTSSPSGLRGYLIRNRRGALGSRLPTHPGRDHSLLRRG